MKAHTGLHMARPSTPASSIIVQHGTGGKYAPTGPRARKGAVYGGD